MQKIGSIYPKCLANISTLPIENVASLPFQNLFYAIFIIINPHVSKFCFLSEVAACFVEFSMKTYI